MMIKLIMGFLGNYVNRVHVLSRPKQSAAEPSSLTALKSPRQEPVSRDAPSCSARSQGQKPFPTAVPLHAPFPCVGCPSIYGSHARLLLSFQA